MFQLVPPAFKAVMKATIRVGIFCEITFSFVLVIAGICGIFQDIFSAFFSSAVFLLIMPFALIPCLRHYKVSQSSVEILSDRIKVLDKRGVCCREIHFDTINRIRVESIAGFFYGQDRNQSEHKYICIFLNDCTQIPNAEYDKLFKHKDFFMLYYSEDALDFLSCKFCSNST